MIQHRFIVGTFVALSTCFLACRGLQLKTTCSVEVDGTTVHGGLSPDGKTCTVEATFSTLTSEHSVKLVKPAQ